MKVWTGEVGSGGEEKLAVLEIDVHPVVVER